MTDNEIIKILECCANADCKRCPCNIDNHHCKDIGSQEILGLINRQKAEIERLQAFKSYFDELYGKGLEVANWHLNGNTEPFDNFYESALEEMTEGENG
ncbi:MAG: hypothetical protein ACI4YB_01890 [Oscillospiraceae bacterium]